VSQGTGLAAGFAQRYGKPVRVIDVAADDAASITAAWLERLVAQLGDHLMLGIGGPRESEAPGIYARARVVLDSVLARAPFAVSAADRRSGSGP
jgi:hypothetical protein